MSYPRTVSEWDERGKASGILSWQVQPSINRSSGKEKDKEIRDIKDWTNVKSLNSIVSIDLLLEEQPEVEAVFSVDRPIGRKHAPEGVYGQEGEEGGEGITSLNRSTATLFRYRLLRETTNDTLALCTCNQRCKEYPQSHRLAPNNWISSSTIALACSSFTGSFHHLMIHTSACTHSRKEERSKFINRSMLHYSCISTTIVAS